MFVFAHFSLWVPIPGFNFTHSLSRRLFHSVHWVPLTGGLASPLGSLGTRSGVCVVDFVHHCALRPAALPLFQQRHFLQMERQDWSRFSKLGQSERQNQEKRVVRRHVFVDRWRLAKALALVEFLFAPLWMGAFECVCVCVCVAGKWSTSKCSEPHGYICKRKTVSVVETPREPHYIGQCPEKWLYFGHKVQTHNSWQNLHKLVRMQLYFILQAVLTTKCTLNPAYIVNYIYILDEHFLDIQEQSMFLCVFNYMVINM